MPNLVFDDFCQSRGPALLRFGFRLTGDWAAAEDIVQTALMNCYPKWSRIEEPDAYVRQAMVRLQYRRSRRRASDRLALTAWGGRRQTSFDGPSYEGDLAEQLLASLPPRQRVILTLRYLEDLDDPSIAAALGISVGTVRSQSARALAKLRALTDRSEESYGH